MKTFQLAGQSRTDLGKKASKALRKDSKVPAVLYGTEQLVSFTVDQSAVRNLIYTPDIFVVELTVDGKSCNAILQDIQFHPVTDEVLHMDFLQTFEEKPILIQASVKLEGL